MFFTDAFVWTYDPRLSKEWIVSPMILWPVQEEALRTFRLSIEDGLDCVVEKSRDMGASWCCLIQALHDWIFRRNQSILLVSRKRDLVDGTRDSLFGHLTFVLKHLPPWLAPPYTKTFMKLENLQNGSFIEGESTNDNIGRGGRRTWLLWDEAAAFEGGGKDVDASTSDTTNTRILNSTPMGIDTAFYEILTNDVSKTVRMHWSQHPRKARGLYRPNPTGGPPEILDTGYPFPADYAFSSKVPRSREGLRSVWYDYQDHRRAANPQLFAREVDIDHAGAVKKFVDAEWLDDYIADHCAEPPEFGHLPGTLQRGEIHVHGDAYQFTPHKEGILSVWCPLNEEMKPPKDREYVLFCDIGVGSNRSDSVCSVGDKFGREKVAELKTRNLGIRAFVEAVMGVARMFRGDGGRWPLLGWEANGPGGNFGRLVTRVWNYPNVYLSVQDKNLEIKSTTKFGWFSTGDSRENLLVNYREALSDEPPFHNPSRPAMKELGLYEYQGDKIVHPAATKRDATSADFGRNHGDSVIADAGMVMLLGDQRTPKPPTAAAKAAPFGSFLHFHRQQQARLQESS